MRIIPLLYLFIALPACRSGEASVPVTQELKATDQNNAAGLATDATPHTIQVVDVIQVESYTYILARENGTEYWLAAPTIQTKKGDILYYENGMMMTNFESKELKRTFDKILFVDRISTTPGNTTPTQAGLPPGHSPVAGIPAQTPAMGSPKDTLKQPLKIEPAKNGVTIAAILKDPKAYEGKSITVKGKVTKYTAGVMGKNWVHIQDGTSSGGKFEIVITTQATMAEGDIITFEGPLTLNKDLGYGYFFEVLIEDARVIK
jgi:hypothetical protein